MNFTKRRRLKNIIHHMLHESRHARHMREDISDPATIQEIIDLEQQLKQNWQDQDEAAIEKTAEALDAKVHEIYPIPANPKMREYVEILVVAIAVAFGFRTYFVQPFKIPTGSMQPTLNGITSVEQAAPGFWDRMPFKIVPFILTGQYYSEIKAPDSGVFLYGTDKASSKQFVRVGNKILKFNGSQNMFLVPHGARVKKGDVVARGRVILGDHIFVNRLKYNFTRAKRGDIIVFSTEGIKHPDVRQDSYYIKRLVGLAEEEIEIKEKALYADGNKIMEPFAFDRLLNDPGYNGYDFPSLNTAILPALAKHTLPYTVEEDSFLPFGDNTKSSLDGRYFGSVKTENLLGPAFAVYWPFGKHWGRVR